MKIMNKTGIRLGLGLVILIISYGVYIVISSGFFREITNSFEGQLYQQIDIPGVEDIQINYQDSFLILSSDDRAARRDGRALSGGLYMIDLRDTSFVPKALSQNISWPFYPHGISLYRVNQRKCRIFAVNHVDDDHTIEVFDLIEGRLTHIARLRSDEMISPNDVVAIDEKRFYFTNDHGYLKGIGRIGEEYLGLPFGNVVYFDGQSFDVVADHIAYANGIIIDEERNLVYVASVRHFLVKVYQQIDKGGLVWIEDIDCGTGVDNISLSEMGRLWIGCHPSLLTYKSYSTGQRQFSPSEIISLDYKGPGNFSITCEYVNDGSEMSASTVACPYGPYLFVGNVMDDHFIILKRKRE